MKNSIKKILGLTLFFFFLVFFLFLSVTNKFIIKFKFFPIPFILEIPFYIYTIIVLFVGFIISLFFLFLRRFFK